MVKSTPEKLQVEWVTQEYIRKLFNETGLFELAKLGNLRTYVKRSSHPTSPPPPGQPLCTWSQIVYYYDMENKPLAIVHQYLRPDGSIGASGLPDPKRLFFEDRIVSVKTKTE
ncbi:MAG: hypothetical protein ACYC6R_14140 [Anaerolineales bacterium]